MADEYSVVIHPEAMAELREIAAFHLNAVGPISARRITDKILRKIDAIAIFPFANPFVPDDDLRRKGYRMAVCEKYLCFYKVIDKIATVYHIAHGATDYPHLLT